MIVSAATEVSTNRWLAENGATALESLLRTIVFHPSVSLLVTNDERVSLDASVGAGKLLGLPRERIIGRRLDDFAESDFRQAIAEDWEAFLQKREHTGKVMTLFPNLRWCSDGMEIRCFNGDKVFVAFALDCCDREAFAFVARIEPLIADDIEELMVAAVEKRFGESLRATREIQWLSDRGSIYRAKSVQALSKHLNLQCLTRKIQVQKSCVT